MQRSFSHVFKHTLFLSTMIAHCALAQGGRLQESQNPDYDTKGNLITSQEQKQSDREQGILHRGGYNPDAKSAPPPPRPTNVAPADGSTHALSARNIYRCKSGKSEVYADEESKYKFSQCRLVRRGSEEPPEGVTVEKLSPNDSQGQEQAPASKQTQTSQEAPSGQGSTPSQAGAQNSTPAQQEAPAQTPAPQQVQTAQNPPQLNNEHACSGAILFKGNTYIFNASEPCPIPPEVFKNRRPIEAEPSYYTQ